MKTIPEKYLLLDWSKRNCELVDETGMNGTQIHYWRKRLNKPRPKLYYQHRMDKRPNKIAQNFGHLDFVNKRDVDLAKEAGVSRERIRQARVYLGMPKSRLHKMGAAQIRNLK